MPAITIRHLLTHTSGLAYDGDCRADVSPRHAGPDRSRSRRTCAGWPGAALLRAGHRLGTMASASTCSAPSSPRSTARTLGDAVAHVRHRPARAWRDTRFAVTDATRARRRLWRRHRRAAARMADPRSPMANPRRDAPSSRPTRIFNADAPQSGGARHGAAPPATS